MLKNYVNNHENSMSLIGKIRLHITYLDKKSSDFCHNHKISV